MVTGTYGAIRIRALRQVHLSTHCPADRPCYLGPTCHLLKSLPVNHSMSALIFAKVSPCGEPTPATFLFSSLRSSTTVQVKISRDAYEHLCYRTVGFLAPAAVLRMSLLNAPWLECRFAAALAALQRPTTRVSKIGRLKTSR